MFLTECNDHRRLLANKLEAAVCCTGQESQRTLDIWKTNTSWMKDYRIMPITEAG
jgi:hypothetical protein